MGRKDHIPEFQKSRMNGRLPFEDIEPRAGDDPAADSLDQRIVIQHPAPGGMDQDRRFFHEGDLRRTDGMVGLPAVGNMDRHDVRATEELFLGHIPGTAGRLDLRRGPADIVVNQLHLEARRTAGHRLADPPQTEDAQRGVVNVQAEELFESPFVPAPFADIGLAFVESARRGQDQRPGEIGGGIVQHAGGVGGHNPMGRAGGEINIVVSDRDVADRFQFGTAAQKILIDLFGQRRQGPFLVGKRRGEFPGIQNLIPLIVHDLKMACEKIENLDKHLTGHQNLLFHHVILQWL